MGRVYVHGGDGRGNLRENREDPAPTVGRLWGSRYEIWLCPTFTPTRASTGNGAKAETDAMRRVATSPVERENRF